MKSLIRIVLLLLRNAEKSDDYANLGTNIESINCERLKYFIASDSMIKRR